MAGLMADRFGNCQLGFTVLAIMAGSGSVFFIFGTKPIPPVEKRWAERMMNAKASH